MKNTIYRCMDLPKQPNFSFTERCFLSFKKRYRVIGHVVLLIIPIVEFCLAVAPLVAVGLVLLALALGFIALLLYLSNYLKTRFHIDGAMSLVLSVFSILIIFFIASCISSIVQKIEENGKTMANQIKRRLNKKVQNEL